MKALTVDLDLGSLSGEEEASSGILQNFLGCSGWVLVDGGFLVNVLNILGELDEVVHDVHMF